MNAPIARPSSAGRPGASPCQNGSLPGWPGAGETRTWSAVMSSIRHELAPSANDVADPRLVDHLLVQLADPPGMPAGPSLAAGQEHAEQAPVGDGPAAGDGQPLRAGPAGERPGHPVPDEPRAAARRIRRSGSGPASMSSTASSTGRVGSANGAARRTVCHQLGDIPVVHRHHRDDLLGEHVERVARDRAAPRSAPSRIRSATTVAWTRSPWYFGKITPRETLTDLMARPADALQPAGHRRRRLDLDDEVDGAHVDAELKAGGGHDGGQPPGLQRLLDLGAAAAGTPSRDARGRPRRARRAEMPAWAISSAG